MATTTNVGVAKGIAIALMVIYGVGLILYFPMAILNLNPTHTYMLPPGAPGVLTSARGGIQWWTVFITSIAALLALAFAILALPKYNSAYGVWITLLIAMTAIHGATMILLGVSYGTCNTDGRPFNICNDVLYCCNFYTNPVNMCPNTSPCTTVGPTPVELKANGAFKWLFWYNVGFLIADVIMVLTIAYVKVFDYNNNGNGNGRRKKKRKQKVEDDEGFIGKATIPIISSKLRQRTVV